MDLPLERPLIERAILLGMSGEVRAYPVRRLQQVAASGTYTFRFTSPDGYVLRPITAIVVAPAPHDPAITLRVDVDQVPLIESEPLHADRSVPAILLPPVERELAIRVTNGTTGPVSVTVAFDAVAIQEAYFTNVYRPAVERGIEAPSITLSPEFQAAMERLVELVRQLTPQVPTQPSPTAPVPENGTKAPWWVPLSPLGLAVAMMVDSALVAARQQNGRAKVT